MRCNYLSTDANIITLTPPKCLRGLCACANALEPDMRTESTIATANTTERVMQPVWQLLRDAVNQARSNIIFAGPRARKL